MNKFKLMCCAPLLAVGVTHAALLPCEGFKVIVNNQVGSELVLQKAQLQGAILKSNGSQTVPSKQAHVFTLSNTQEVGVIQGELVLTTVTIPQKQVNINVSFKNNTTSCELQGFSVDGSLVATKIRVPGGVEFKVQG